MNRGTMILQVQALLGNMPTDDPMYLQIPQALTDGLSQVVMMAVNHEKASRDRVNLFPELHTTWTSGLAVADNAAVDLPADMIAVYHVQSYDSDDVAAAIGTATLRDLRKVPLRRYGQLDKTLRDYPQVYAFRERSVLLYPVPDADHETFLEFLGYRRDYNFVSRTDNASEPRIDEMFHTTACQLAAYNLAVVMGWGSDATQFYHAAELTLATSIDKTALSEGDDNDCVEIEGWINRGDVYG